MSPKICRNVVALAALAAALSVSPLQAAGPQLREARPETPWQAVASFWSAATHQVVSWWKHSQQPSPQKPSCQNGAISCSNPKPPGEVGSAIDPDGKP
ncbi:MAG TPA: hypothetical protein VEL74_04600 [Thermoanaerobaculia bacterium]|nr:hypothetical protein [Thermoanaerobaculia bacterium]